MAEESRAPNSFEQLVARAFQQAREKGRADWRHMHVAVLKNRLLQITNNTFDERDYGASSIWELAASVPHVLRFDGRSVEFLETGLELGSDARVRVRPDLWRAVVDFSSGKKYAWDERLGVAREASATDARFLPTLTREEVANWRAEFVASQPALPALEAWRDEAGSTADLPVALRGPWNGFFRDKVRARLERWFSDHELERPHVDEVIAPSRERTRSAADDRTALLRRLIIACVDVMTDAELRELRLPPDAVLRAQVNRRLP